jgi:hypothetical protein
MNLSHRLPILLGDEFLLDPIDIKGEGPRRKGIFADTSYDELFGEDESALPRPGIGHFALLALLAAGLYLTAKS